MLIVATLLWDPNPKSFAFSRDYDETWVNRLYAGFKRNLTVDFQFAVFTDRRRKFAPGIHHQLLLSDEPGYLDCLQPYLLNMPMILVGLDTLIIGNIDHLAEHCFTSTKIALPRDPYPPHRAINGVQLAPQGFYDVWWNRSAYAGMQFPDMEALRAQPHVIIDDLWPGHVRSYKGSVQGNHDHPPADTRIVYFHGVPKMDRLKHLSWVQEHWRE